MASSQSTWGTWGKSLDCMFPWAHVNVLKPHTVIEVCPSARGSRAGIGEGQPACRAERAGGARVLVHPCLEMPLRPGPLRQRRAASPGFLWRWVQGLRGSGDRDQGQVGPPWWAGGKHHFCIPLERKHLVPSLECRKGLCYMQATMALAHSALSNKLTCNVQSREA